MAYANTTDQAATLAQRYTPGFESAVYRQKDFMQLFPRSTIGGATDIWTPNTSGNTSAATFSEGDAAPAPGGQGYTALTATPVYFWAWARVTGRQLDIARVGGHKPGLAVMDGEIMGGLGDLADLVENTFIGSTSGIEHIISASNTVYGVAQGSAAWHQSHMTALSGVLTQAALTNITEGARDGKNGRYSVILSPHNQVTNYTNLLGAAGAANNSVRHILPNGVDLGPDPTDVAFQRKPWLGMDIMTDTFIAGLDLRPTAYGPNWEYKVARPFQVDPPQKVGDDHLIELSHAGVLVCRLVQRNWGLTAVTA